MFRVRARCFALALAFRFWPVLPTCWHKGLFWTEPLMLGVPAGEFAFHGALGAAWPVMIAFFLDARPVSPSP